VEVFSRVYKVKIFIIQKCGGVFEDTVNFGNAKTINKNYMRNYNAFKTPKKNHNSHQKPQTQTPNRIATIQLPHLYIENSIKIAQMFTDCGSKISILLMFNL
jgi:hypothetical protein